ncbi:(2Fe-2S)-binding protein [miscellaneous Crenarchaeota group-15 archaeon DG-45]|uniref:(2Fe-2S)-binding protein n=1 Tax=miscellaneous Crenarchaeota group-15 archaeon DG-45 TaxID=1685127 RepID=A0A0M0BNR2_9ARCH|nr:MAG: (2Fe-2S)-binding protein [miscellaneous Crenarchaeota group-15 archaeon DG-45]
MRITFQLNGKRIVCETAQNRTLLDLLRVDLGLTSVKKGCEEGECGSCTVLLDGMPVNSCLVLAPQVEGSRVTTVEGLEDDDLMVALRRAFMEDGAIQCGFCTPGMLISAYALLSENPNPTEDEVKTAIEGNLCRCTGYVKIIEAILDAAERMPVE